MKQWPENEEMADFEDLITPVRRAMKAAYTLRRKNADQDVPYDGYDFGTGYGCSPDPTSLLSKEGLDHASYQGRDALDAILQIAFNLGFEQGRRSNAKDVKFYKNIAQDLLDALKMKSGNSE